MSRIRDLLDGPVIADETARRDESIGRLDRALADQSETIGTLLARIDDLEQAQRADAEKLNLRLLGMVEALLTDQENLRDRLAESDHLKAYLGEAAPGTKGSDQSG